ncbi:MAG TPA: sigma-70 family RNA polymerase sigma factor [Gemmataceae bacterium]|nr:sigma-70 family RNA polymerase sigma factor [Gemmataceae bacterium]
MGSVLRHLQRLTVGQALKELTDAQLLGRFTASGNQAAFTALMQRHGALVLTVCRNLLGHEQDAEDAFQATFLVLARKAESVVSHQNIAGWLHRAACHCALQVKRAGARRAKHERQARMKAQPPCSDESSWRELQAILQEEVARLADKYRAPFVLCCLEGKTKAEAALDLGWKEGTVSGRLAQARKLLRQRLARRGVLLSATLSALALTRKALAIVPAPLADATQQGVLELMSKASTTSVLSAQVMHVVHKVSKTMLLAKWKTHVTVLLASSALLMGTGALAYRSVASWSSADTTEVHPRKPAKLEESPMDFALLQGKWKVVEHTVNGIQVRSHDNPAQFWTISGDKIMVDYRDGNLEVMRFQLDETKTPRYIDVTAIGDDDPRRSVAGIYDLTDQSLTLCLATADSPRRPTAFYRASKRADNSACPLLVLEKLKND